MNKTWKLPQIFKIDKEFLSRGDLLPVLILFYPIFLLLPGYFSFPYPASGSAYSDVSITHFPNAVFLLRALSEWGDIPLWSPTILSGYPFVAHPLSALFYPPGWLALLFPLPFGFNLTVALHLAWGGLGMYSLMRLEGASKIGALFSGLAFASLPKLFAQYGAGHLTLLYAIPWTPWLLAAQLAGSRGSNVSIKRALLPGIIFGAILLADIRWGIFAGLTWWSYLIAHSHFREKKSHLVRLMGQTSLAILIAAPLILPLLEYTRLSTRSALTAADNSIYSLPFYGLIGLLFPNLSGTHEWVLYSGGVVLVLVVISSIIRNLSSAQRFWGVFCILTLLFSLGANIPGMGLIYNLPGLDLLRVPSRALFLTGLSLCALAGYGLDRMLVNMTYLDRSLINLSLTGLIVLVSGLCGGLYLITGRFSTGMGLGTFAIISGSLWTILIVNHKVSRKLWTTGIFLLAMIDWSVAAQAGIIWRDSHSVLSAGKDAIQYISSQEGYFRTYSPSYSLPQQTASIYGLELADGVDPLQLASYATYMNKASGVPGGDYGVTIPPFATANPEIDNARYVPNLELLGFLNVRYVASAFDINAAGLVLEKKYGETRLYRNSLEMPRAWVESTKGKHPAAIIEWSPNHLDLIAEGPGNLVLSELAYPGWKVSVDGERSEIHTYHNLLRSVDLDDGVHKVSFTFMPSSLFAGLTVWVLMLLGLGVWGSKKLISSINRSGREANDIPVRSD